MITIADLFCGAGGSGLGASVVPGVQLRYAANHWRTAVETHAANFPNTDHDVADISQVDPRRTPRTDILWASPECTNHSVAKGRKRPTVQPDLFGETLPDEAAERSRATMWDVPRFAEHHRYRAVIVENVVDAARWVMWPAWLQAMTLLGYRHRVVYLNSMHAPAIAAPRAPQSRDRLYVVFWRDGQPAPELDVRPLAWCEVCGMQVAARQSWKRTDRAAWGRYRAQYVYRCPRPECRFSIVEPYVDPAAAAIDWTLRGQRIGDRDRPLSAKTIERIRAGLARYARPLTFKARGNTFVRTGPDGLPVYARAWPVDQPTATLTTTETRALVVPVEGREGKTAAPVTSPLRTQSTRAETALVVPSGGTWNEDARPTGEPFRARTAVENEGIAFIAELRGGGSDARHVREPLATVTASGNHHMLVRHNSSKGDGGEMCTPATAPARTLTTTGHQSLVGWPRELPQVEECTFRMLEPREIQAAMAFRRDYHVLGTRREQVRQLGNAVTPPAAEFLIRAVVNSLGGGR
jgi:DNA (cytosine-5)-methyltransferase 1